MIVGAGAGRRGQRRGIVFTLLEKHANERGGFVTVPRVRWAFEAIDPFSR